MTMKDQRRVGVYYLITSYFVPISPEFKSGPILLSSLFTAIILQIVLNFKYNYFQGDKTLLNWTEESRSHISLALETRILQANWYCRGGW